MEFSEKEHLSNVLERNHYPRSFVYSSTTHHPEVKEKTTDSNEVRIIIPYTKGMSEDIRRVCRSYGITTVFKSSTTIRGLLSRADLNKNRAFRDKSMKLGTWFLDILRIILRNGATYDLTFGDL